MSVLPRVLLLGFAFSYVAFSFTRTSHKVLHVVQANKEATPYHRVKDENLHWFLGACGSVKNNAAWLREWLLLQRAAGLDHIWLVNDNDDDDGTAAILQQFEDIGFVTVIPGRFPTKFAGCEGGGGRPGGVKESNCVAPKFCFSEVGPHVDWLLFVDSDEFMYPRTGCSVAEHIRRHCNPWETHISVGWERFGGSRFTSHPAGLMTENFLESAGECEDETTYNQANPSNNPFGVIGTCVHRKIIYNTKCLTVDHAGWVHFVVNTTEFHKAKYPYNQMNGPGFWKHVAGEKGAPFKDARCKLTTYKETMGQCMAWLEKGGGAGQEVEYSAGCCTAGIGYNHYGYKSSEYWGHKMLDVGNRERGRKLGKSHEWRIDVRGVISHGILKFVRALRDDHQAKGFPVSRRVRFIDDEASGKTCFAERGFRYEAQRGTAAKKMPQAGTEEACCAACIATKGCHGYTMKIDNDGKKRTCTVLIPPATTRRGRQRLIRQVVPAGRVWDREAASGIVLSEGDCPSP